MIAPHEKAGAGPAAEFAATLCAALPQIETERLILRAPRIADFQAYAEITEGPGGRFLMDSPDREAAWFDFANMTAAWLLRGHGLWTVVAKSSPDEILGFVVIGFEPGDHEPELGYMFREPAHGQGFAGEAAAAARDFAYSHGGLSTLVSTIDRENAASRKLAERLGAIRDPEAERAHNDKILVYRHPTPEVRT